MPHDHTVIECVMNCAFLGVIFTHSGFLASPTDRQSVEGVCGTRDLQDGLLFSSSADSGLDWVALRVGGDVGTSCRCCG